MNIIAPVDVYDAVMQHIHQTDHPDCRDNFNQINNFKNRARTYHSDYLSN